MELDQVFEKRKSCRLFADYGLGPHETYKILFAAKKAPYASGGPRCMMKCITVKEYKEKLKAACFNQHHVATCSLAIVFFALDPDTELRSGHKKYIFDCAAAAMCMDLMAVSLGLGTCWIGHFDPDKVKAVLETNMKPVIILLIGKRKTHDATKTLRH